MAQDYSQVMSILLKFPVAKDQRPLPRRIGNLSTGIHETLKAGSKHVASKVFRSAMANGSENPLALPSVQRAPWHAQLTPCPL